MQTFIEFIKELDPNFTLEESCCPKCDCDPCKCKKDDKKGKNPFFAKKDKGEDKSDDKKDDKKGKNPFFAKKDKGEKSDE